MNRVIHLLAVWAVVGVGLLLLAAVPVVLYYQTQALKTALQFVAGLGSLAIGGAR